MNMITMRHGSTVFCKDWDSATPVAFSHGWPLLLVFLKEVG